MGFSDLKKKSRDIGALTAAADKINKKSESYKDDRFWRPELDQSSEFISETGSLSPMLVHRELSYHHRRQGSSLGDELRTLEQWS